MNERKFSRKSLAVGAWVLSVIVALALGWWASGQATRPPAADLPKAKPAAVEVSSGTVSVEQAYGINVDWPVQPVGVNGAGGTLTTLNLPSEGTQVKAGDILYTVDLSPVVIAEGSIPAFRPLGPGDSGADVLELEKFLSSAGYQSGNVDGVYGSATSDAVRRWTKSLGLPTDSTVPMGRIVFVPKLPTVVAPKPGLRVGDQVSPGDALLVTAAAEPVFSFTVLPEAVSTTQPGMVVKIQAASEEWEAQVDRLETSTDQLAGTIAILKPAEGEESICSDSCAKLLRLGQKAVLAGTLVYVAPTTGPVLPTAAILTDANGQTFVILADGKKQDVTVRASNDGQTVVDGLKVGDRVQLSGAPTEG
ncbi:MAG: peptidoglycan-binding protein [Microbacteriaceae bacterium]|nr:peptidoglycan-binding protein [Microbacteriaceae bacterium]